MPTIEIKPKNKIKKQEVQLFFANLLLLLTLDAWASFYLILEDSALGLTIGLAIGGSELIGEEITIGLLR